MGNRAAGGTIGGGTDRGSPARAGGVTRRRTMLAYFLPQGQELLVLQLIV